MRFRHGLFAAAAIAATVSLPVAAAPRSTLTLTPSDPKAPPVTVEPQGFSWGATNGGSHSSAGGGAGRAQRDPSLRDGDGRTDHRYKFGRDNKMWEPPMTDGVLAVALSPDAAKACTPERSFPSATLTDGDRRWTMSDVTITACDRDGMMVSYRKLAPPDSGRGISEKGIK